MEDQLGVARNSKSKNEDGYYTGRGLPRVVAVGVPPASTGGALQLVLQTLGSEPTPPVGKNPGDSNTVKVHSRACHNCR